MIRDNGQPITIYGRATCRDTRRARDWFAAHGRRYRYVDIAVEREVAPLIQRVTDGRFTTPVITFPDGSYLVAPAPRELADAAERWP